MTADPFVVIVCGSRTWLDRELIYLDLDMLLAEHGKLTIIYGACPEGADTMARGWAQSRRQRYLGYPPEYGRYPPKIAPLKRNTEMARLPGVKLCLAYQRGDTPGTRHMIKQARKYGVEVRETKVSK